MKRPSYRAAIKWIAENDDNEWTKELDGFPSVSACLVADLFKVPESKVITDIKWAVRHVS